MHSDEEELTHSMAPAMGQMFCYFFFPHGMICLYYENREDMKKQIVSILIHQA